MRVAVDGSKLHSGESEVTKTSGTGIPYSLLTPGLNVSLVCTTHLTPHLTVSPPSLSSVSPL